MSYIVPSVQVYQELANSGGVANVTPTLTACIIGPAYNVVWYVPGSTASLIETAAQNTTTAPASIASGSYSLLFNSIPPFTVGTQVYVAGAGVNGGVLTANVLSVSSLTITLDTAASTTVTNATVSQPGVISNPAVTNTFALPSQLPGQVLVPSSLGIYLNNAAIQTVSTGMNGYAGSNVLTYAPASGTANTSAASAVITSVTNPTSYAVGDLVTIAGAGTAGGLLTANIAQISGSTFTLSAPAVSATTAAAMTKISISNINANTSTYLIEPGDGVVLTYGANTFKSTVLQVLSQTGTITSVTIADILPANVAAASTTTASVTSGATTFTLTSSTGFATGGSIMIPGAGANGSTYYGTIGTLTGAVVSGLTPAIGTTVPMGTTVQAQAIVTYQSRKIYNNQLLPAVNPINSSANYNASATPTSGTVIIEPNPGTIYGPLISGSVYIEYRALRTDLSNRVLTINNDADAAGQLGVLNQYNPLGLGVQVALANTTTSVNAIAISTDDETGYANALSLAQGQQLYALAVLTQDLEVGQALNLHCTQMSTPPNQMWRIGLFNSLIQSVTPIGQYTSSLVNANGGNNTITLVNGNYVLTASNATFISDGVSPGDTVNITAGTGTPSPIGTVQVLNVISNQQLQVAALGTATAVSYYVSRNLSNTQRAANVAAISTTFGSNRLCHVQPDTVFVNINNVNVQLPGYYLGCAVAGLVAGFPAQQGFTNIGIAGISSLANSNFTFTTAQLNTMAGAGTCLFVQEVPGGIPYCRHELMTDMAVYYYREMQAVKNWDFISYYFKNILSPFIGKWNITPETLTIIRQTIDAGANLLMSQKLPRIGAPLLGYTIATLAQDATNVDQVDCNLSIQIPTVLNYLNVYLTI